MNDLRYAVRSLARMRGLAVIIIAALAIGIGATTTMFSATYAALLRPVPFDDPDRLVLLFTTRTTPAEGLVRSRWSRRLIRELESSARSFESIASFTPSLVAISGAGDPTQIDAEIVSPGYFETLRVTPAIGRTFTAAEDSAPGSAPVAILSDRLWRLRYGADPALVGSAVRVNGVPLTVVGILPPGFSGLSERSQLWIPRTMAPRLTYDGYLTTSQLFIGVVGRLKTGVTRQRANAELEALAAAFTGVDRSGAARWGAVAERLGEARIDSTLRRSLIVLLSAAVCVLLITCANVASLLLARGRARRRELAIRIAMGSGRARIVRQLLVEALVLAGAAGLLGTALAVWSVNLFARYSPAVLITGRTAMSTFSTPSVDAGSLLFAAGLTLVTTVLCGLAPAIDTLRADLGGALKEDSRGGGSRRRVFSTLVVGEVAVAIVLLAAAGVLLDSFIRAQHLRRGFRTDGVLTFWVRPPVSRYAIADGPKVLERLLASVERVAGVESAAVNRCTPFTGCSRTVVFFPDRPVDPERAPTVGRHYISPGYFKTLGIPLLAGRVLTADDRAGRPPVAVISDSAARRFWPGENPIGKRVWFAGSTGPFNDREHPVEIVGVVGDVKYEAVDWPDSVGRPEFYTSYLQFSYTDSMVIVKTRGPSAGVLPALRRAVADVDAALPIYDVLTLDDRIGLALSRPRFNAALVSTFAAAALLLAALGVYGMLSYSVSLRAREIAVRLALGAAPPRVVRLVVFEGLRLTAAGAAIGLAASAGAGRLIQGLVVDAAPSDPRVLTAITILMLAIAAVAAYLPARRAAVVDPIRVLRQE